MYLHALDEFVKRELRCPAYVRYCDDFLLFANDKPTLHRLRHAIEEFLIQLRLVLHDHKTAVYPVSNGIPFLGFLVFSSHRRLARSNGLRFQRRWRRLVAALAVGQINREQLESSLRGWIAHACHGDTYGLRHSLITRTAITLPRQQP